MYLNSKPFFLSDKYVYVWFCDSCIFVLQANDVVGNLSSLCQDPDVGATIQYQLLDSTYSQYVYLLT